MQFGTRRLKHLGSIVTGWARGDKWGYIH
jgi:hypothetical protein